jgi:hypothetical protein
MDALRRNVRARALERFEHRDRAAAVEVRGIWIATCDRADLRATPTGLRIYADQSIGGP